MTTVNFAAIGFAHNHIFGITKRLIEAGANLVAYYDEDDSRIAEFLERFPNTPRAESVQAILDDETIQVVATAARPDKRAKLGIKTMQHSKDFISAKPSFTNIEDLAEARRVQAETGQIYSVFYGERLDNPSTVKAGELVKSGAIGQVVQTVGFGPHRLLNHGFRPDWTFDRQYFGGVINDLASHQIDQFLYFTDSTSAEVVSAHVGNFRHQQYPEIHDFGDVVVRSPSAVGYVRVDWLTPQGLDTWGDVRLFIQGTAGYIELRKNTDITGREGNNHLFLVNEEEMQHIDCRDVHLPFGEQFLHDVLHRTETAMPQAHCFLASELALQAELQAVELQSLAMG